MGRLLPFLVLSTTVAVVVRDDEIKAAENDVWKEHLKLEPSQNVVTAMRVLMLKACRKHQTPETN